MAVTKNSEDQWNVWNNPQIIKYDIKKYKQTLLVSLSDIRDNERGSCIYIRLMGPLNSKHLPVHLNKDYIVSSDYTIQSVKRFIKDIKP